jgi:phage tail sheath protein FI
MSKPRITNNLPAFHARISGNARKGMTQALILGASEAASMTPIDTGTLINSQTRMIEDTPTSVIGRAGYTALYAEPVHDPDVKQTFRRAGAEKSFLKKGFEQAEPNIKAVITGAIRV